MMRYKVATYLKAITGAVNADEAIAHARQCFADEIVRVILGELRELSGNPVVLPLIKNLVLRKGEAMGL